MSSHQIASVTITTQRCSLTYGESPCTASRHAGLECANTYGTCQDKPNYAATAGSLTFVPSIGGGTGIAAIIDYKASPAQIGAAGLGIGFDAAVTLQDFETLADDLLADPYASTRSPVSGTYLGRLFARYDNLIGRTVEIRQTSGVIQYGVLNAINRSDGDRWQLRITDPMQTALAADVQPAQTAVVSTLAVTAAADSIRVELLPEPVLSDTYFLIGEEVVKVNADAAARASNLSVDRAQFGTTATAHNIGAELSSIYYWDTEPVENIIRDLVVGRIVPSSLLDFEAVGTEFTGGFAKAQPLGELLEDLLASGLAYLWWDSYRQRLRLASIAPWGETIPELDASLILDEGVEVRSRQDWQRTRAIVGYGGTSPVAEEDKEIKLRTATYIDGDLESSAGLNKLVEIEYLSRWIGTNDEQAELIARRLVERWSSLPLVVTLKIPEEYNDTYRLGDVVDVVAAAVAQKENGEPKRIRMLITEVDPSPGVIQLRLISWLPYTSTTPITNIDIDTDDVDVNVFALAGSPTVPVTLTVRILEDIEVSASEYTVPALNIAGFHPESQITLVLESGAAILGAGGYGGTGAYGNIVSNAQGTFQLVPAENGFDGGTAVRFTSGTLTIDNAGTIAGGGGGGAGGDATAIYSAPDGEGRTEVVGYIAGGGGGGGAGHAGGTGGGGANNLYIEGVTFYAPPHPSQDGTTGTRTAAGTAGAGGTYNPGGLSFPVNGRNGEAGGLRGEDAPGAHAGRGGYAVELGAGATAYAQTAGSQFGRGQVTDSPPIPPSGGDAPDWAANWSVIGCALRDDESFGAQDNGGRFGSITGGMHLIFNASWNNTGKYVDVTADQGLVSSVGIAAV